MINVCSQSRMYRNRGRKLVHSETLSASSCKLFFKKDGQVGKWLKRADCIIRINWLKFGYDGNNWMFRSIVHFYHHNLLAIAFGGSNPSLPTDVIVETCPLTIGLVQVEVRCLLHYLGKHPYELTSPFVRCNLFEEGETSYLVITSKRLVFNRKHLFQLIQK